MGPTRLQQREDTRARVLRVATSLFSQVGFESTTVRDIATASGTSVGTVMGVGDKEQLLIRVLDAKIATTQTAALGGPQDAAPHGLTPTQTVLHLLNPFIELFARNQSLSRAYAAILVGGRHDSVVFTELAAALIREIGQRLGRFDRNPERANRLAEACYHAYLGWLFALPAEDLVDESAAKGKLERILAAILDGGPVN